MTTEIPCSMLAARTITSISSISDPSGRTRARRAAAPWPARQEARDHQLAPLERLEAWPGGAWACGAARGSAAHSIWWRLGYGLKALRAASSVSPTVSSNGTTGRW